MLLFELTFEKERKKKREREREKASCYTCPFFAIVKVTGLIRNKFIVHYFTYKTTGRAKPKSIENIIMVIGQNYVIITFAFFFRNAQFMMAVKPYLVDQIVCIMLGSKLKVLLHIKRILKIVNRMFYSFISYINMLCSSLIGSEFLRFKDQCSSWLQAFIYFFKEHLQSIISSVNLNPFGYA